MLSARPSESRLPFWTWAALPLLVAAWLRFRGLGTLEPFVDEAGNILVALDSRVKTVVDPLGQGRPLLACQFLPAGWFPAHALLVARLLSAGAGLATVSALGLALFRLAGRPAALCGMALWATMPFAVFHERLALQDTFVAALLAWSTVCIVTGVSRPEGRRPLWFVVAGTFFGTAFLIKISAVFALGWLGLIYSAIQRSHTRRIFGRELVLLGLGALAPLALLGPSLFKVGQHSSRFESLPVFDSGHYWASAAGRLATWLRWHEGYGGWPLLLLLAGALVLSLRARSRVVGACALGSVLALLVSALFYNRPFARYALPDHLPLVFFLSLAWGRALVSTAGRTRALAAAVLLVALGRWTLVSRQIGTAPETAAIPAQEIAQYVTGPWSGRGLNDVRRFLGDYADRHNVRCLVLTHRFLRPGCYGLMLAELGDPRIGVVPFTVYEPSELAASLPGLKKISAGQRVAFFLLYEGSLYPAAAWLDQPGAPTRRVFTTPHGAADKFTLYQFEP
ncbi:MAG: glycosyltransferase family 39 protein [Opitutae bacterium]|nr:glycosyltransferase family 39 protein [Opitutae bacterium]